MKVECSIIGCGATLESLLIPYEKAIIDLTAKVAMHISKAHPEQYQIMQADTMAVLEGLGFYMLMTGFTNITVDETFILGKISAFETEMKKLITPADTSGGDTAITDNVLPIKSS